MTPDTDERTMAGDLYPADGPEPLEAMPRAAVVAAGNPARVIRTIEPGCEAVPTIESGCEAVPTIESGCEAVPTIEPSCEAGPTIEPGTE